MKVSKKWYEVYAKYWNKEERKWQLTKFNIFKFLIIKIYFKIHGYLFDIEDFKYVPSKNVKFKITF